MVEFGDVIYRPCLSYAGKKNFINSQIVLDVKDYGSGPVIHSIDAFGQKWSDFYDTALDSIIFTDKEIAKQCLAKKISEKAVKVANSTISCPLKDLDAEKLYPSQGCCFSTINFK